MKLKKIKLPFKVKNPVLALGTQTKNTVCFAQGNYAYLSPVYRDLNSPKDFLKFKETAEYFLKKKPRIIAYDLHPEYQSTKYALGLNTKRYRLQAIQHHHAHIASCMAENGLNNRRVIGVAFDGTGLGDDLTLWGGEFLICDYRSYKRAAYLREAPLIGGERAIAEPWRLIAYWRDQAGGDKIFTSKRPFWRIIEEKNWPVLKKMYLSGVNSPMSSSIGRLFDAASGMILGKGRAAYEAELAIKLEKKAQKYRESGRGRSKAGAYSFRIRKKQNNYIIDPLGIFKGIAADLDRRQDQGKIAHTFHLSVAEIILRTCLLLRKEKKINRVAFSGGVFQNRLLLDLSAEMLLANQFDLLRHSHLSCNDSSVSFGQAVIASFF